MITKSDGFGNCGNKIYTNFGENAFDKVNLRGNYRIATVEYNTSTSELTIQQYPDVSKTVILGESSTSRNAMNSHKDVIAEILDWANMSMGDFNNLDKDKNYVIYNASNPASERYMYYNYDKSAGEWMSNVLHEGDEFYNLQDDIKYRYIDGKIINAVDVTLKSRNLVSEGKSTGIELTVFPSTGEGVKLGLATQEYAGLMPAEDKMKLDNISTKIGSVLELGNPVNGKIPLYLKSDNGDVLSTVQLDEDDYIDDIRSSIATEDDPVHGIKAGDKILIFTLTNGRETVISLERWFTYYTGEKTNAINTEVVDGKIKSTLLLANSASNLSKITSNGLLTELLWKSGDNQVRFIKGSKSSYDSITYAGYIYFATDTKEVIVDGVAYGIDLTAQDLELVKKITETDTPGKILVTKSNGATYEITIPVVDTAKNGLMKSTDKAKLDGIESGAQVNIIENVLVNNTKQPVSNKTVTLDVYNKAQVNSLVSNGIRYKGESTSVANLPILKETGDAYRITVEKQGLATGAVVFWDGDKWATFTGNLDLSNYATKQDLENQSDTDLSNIRRELDTKVDKIDGKQLSTNDFSNDDRAKSANLSSYLTSAAETTILGKINLNFTSKDALTGKEITQPAIILSEATIDHNGLMSSKHYDIIEGLQTGDNYLDKTGTPSATWQLSKNTGPKIKNSGGQFELRNATDDTYADLIVKDITITGNVTQEGSSFITEAETVEVTDNTILLNKGEVGAGVTKGFAGLEVDRGTLPLYKIYFDESDDRFKAGSGTDLWPIMLRDEESTLTEGGILTWDATTKRAKTAFNIDDLADTYLPLAGGTMTGPLYLKKNVAQIGFTGENNTIEAAIIYVDPSGSNPPSFIMGSTEAGATMTLNAPGGLFYNLNGSRKIWNETNDGADSGLDADLLDGQHGSYYAKATDYIPLAGNSEDTPITGHLYTKDVFGWGLYGMKIEGADGLPRTAHIQFNSNQTGAMGSEPAKSNAYTEMGSIGEVWGPNTVSQLRVGYEDNLPVLKYRNNPGDGTSIKEYNIYHEGNLDISQFATVTSLDKYLPKTGGAMSGSITMNSGSIVITPRSHLAATFNGNPTYFILDVLEDTLLSFGNGHYDLNIVSTNDLQHNVHDGNGKYTLYKIYDERNLDISTFALKTDLDNIDLSGYLPLTGGTMAGSIILPQSSYSEFKGIMADPTWNGAGSKACLLTYTNRGSSHELDLGNYENNSQLSTNVYGRYINVYGSYNIRVHTEDSVEMYAPTVKVTSTGKTIIGGPLVVDANDNKYWTAGNDGAGSGLDADLLDGRQGSDYALTSSLNSYLPLSAGESNKLTGTLWAPVGTPGGASNFNVNVVAGGSTVSNAGIEVNAKGTSIGFGAHEDGNGYFWVGGNGTQEKGHFATINKTSRGMNFIYRPMYAGTNLATISEVVTLDTTQTISGAKTFTSAVTGTNGFYDTSDIRLKSNVKEIKLSSERIKLYEFDKNDKHSYGVIAQEVEKLYPSTVQEGEDGYKVVNYNEILTIKCAELEAENKAIKDRLDSLEQLLFNKGIL